MELIINGESRTFDAPLTLAGVIDALGLSDRRIAVEHNLEIVPRSAWADTPVKSGDRLEIVHAIGGG
ncbi:MAG: sulfur carrier protein ThiS [Gammaproteobacteria bacterium]|nr:MAG: sulfur carrier protein ThiS [Gammaproteobacteria bacterium]